MELVLYVYLTVSIVTFAVLFVGVLITQDDLPAIAIAISVCLVPLLWPLILLLLGLRYLKKGYV